MKRTMTILFILMMSAILGLGAQTGEAVNVGGDGIAVGGYDPVAYFRSGEAVPGNAGMKVEWNGAAYLFSSDENRRLFLDSPEAYLPQYGGYCAWAVGQGYLAGVDPEAWTIHDDRLYLNYSKSVQRRFQRDTEGNIAAADANWPGLRD